MRVTEPNNKSSVAVRRLNAVPVGYYTGSLFSLTILCCHFLSTTAHTRSGVAEDSDIQRCTELMHGLMGQETITVRSRGELLLCSRIELPWCD